MASAIIGGLLAKDISKQHIYVAEPWDVNRDKMAALGVRTTADNVEASRDADIVIIAVKPQVAKVACTELGAAWADRERLPLVISIAAGITVASYVEWFSQGSGRTPPIVRVMPNTPALVGEGASGLFANEGVSADEKDLATALLASVSRAAEWVDKESLLDVVTGISGKSSKSTIPSPRFQAPPNSTPKALAPPTSSPLSSTSSPPEPAWVSPRSRPLAWPSRLLSVPERCWSRPPRTPPS